jgi:hypothetical protein
MEGDMRGPSSADCEKSTIKAGLAQINSTVQLSQASLVQIQPMR